MQFRQKIKYFTHSSSGVLNEQMHLHAQFNSTILVTLPADPTYSTHPTD